jgi:hypothetical protein
MAGKTKSARLHRSEVQPQNSPSKTLPVEFQAPYALQILGHTSTSRPLYMLSFLLESQTPNPIEIPLSSFGSISQEIRRRQPQSSATRQLPTESIQLFDLPE